MRDRIVVGTLVLAFATLCTVHVGLAVRLIFAERPRWRGALALVVPPLAPLWGWRQGFRRSAAVWLGAVVVYVAALLLARF